MSVPVYDPMTGHTVTPRKGTRNRAIIRTGRWTPIHDPGTLRRLWMRRIRMVFPNRPRRPDGLQHGYDLQLVADDEMVRGVGPNINILKEQARAGVMDMVRKWMKEVDLS